MNPSIAWSENECKMLEEQYLSLSKRELIGLFPQRSWIAIRYKAQRMDLFRPMGGPPLEPNLKDNIMPYVLGTLMGDGSVCSFVGKRYEQHRVNKKMRLYPVSLQCRDKPFAMEFCNALEIIGLHPKLYGPYLRKAKLLPSGRICMPKPIYMTRAYSKRLYEWYQQFNPKTNPDWLRNLESYLDTPEKIRLFIKGFYESEGSVFNKKNTWRITFYNKNNILLKMIKRLLEKMNFMPREVKINYFYICSGSKQFLEWIQPVIKNVPRRWRDKN